MACLWANIDDYLKTLIETAYTVEVEGVPTKTLACVVAEQLDPDNHQLPVCLIRGNESETGDADYPFGDGAYHIDGITYPYELIVIDADDDYSAIKGKMAEHGTKVRDVIRSVPAFGGLSGESAAPGAGVERVQRVDIGNVTLYVRGRAGQNKAGKYVGAAALQIAVVSQI